MQVRVIEPEDKGLKADLHMIQIQIRHIRDTKQNYTGSK